MGIKCSGNLLWKSEPLAFMKIANSVKNKHDLTKSNNNSRSCPIIVIDANAISHKSPKEFDVAKHADIAASARADNMVEAMVMVDNPVR